MNKFILTLITFYNRSKKNIFFFDIITKINLGDEAKTG